MPDLIERLASGERYLFAALNAVARPLVQRGVGSPCLTPVGLVVLEHRGRKTGATHATPLWAVRVGQQLLVSTFRGQRSQWMQNLDKTPETHVWLGGRRREFHASLARARGEAAAATLPKTLGDRLVEYVRGSSIAFGLTVAVLRPT